jgi:hypothetical protein
LCFYWKFNLHISMKIFCENSRAVEGLNFTIEIFTSISRLWTSKFFFNFQAQNMEYILNTDAQYIYKNSTLKKFDAWENLWNYSMLQCSCLKFKRKKGKEKKIILHYLVWVVASCKLPIQIPGGNPRHRRYCIGRSIVRMMVNMGHTMAFFCRFIRSRMPRRMAYTTL